MNRAARATGRRKRRKRVVYDKRKLKTIVNGAAKWREKTLGPLLAKSPERQARFSTVSDEEIRDLYGPADVEAADYGKDLGFPGE